MNRESVAVLSLSLVAVTLDALVWISLWLYERTRFRLHWAWFWGWLLLKWTAEFFEVRSPIFWNCAFPVGAVVSCLCLATLICEMRAQRAFQALTVKR